MLGVHENTTKIPRRRSRRSPGRGHRPRYACYGRVRIRNHEAGGRRLTPRRTGRQSNEKQTSPGNYGVADSCDGAGPVGHLFVCLATPALAQENPPPDKTGGDSSDSRNCSAPPAPSNFEVTEGSGHTQVGASWNAVTNYYGGSLGYQLSYKQSSSISWSNVWPTGQSTSYDITGLTSGQSYQFKVRAYVYVGGVDCEGIWSDTETVTLGSTTTPPIVTPTTPGPPTNLAAARHSTISNRLSVTFTRSESPHYYQFELWSATSEHGSYSLVTTATQNVSSSPADFGNQTRERWYKARGKNCATASRTNCSA